MSSVPLNKQKTYVVWWARLMAIGPFSLKLLAHPIRVLEESYHSCTSFETSPLNLSKYLTPSGSFSCRLNSIVMLLLRTCTT